MAKYTIELRKIIENYYSRGEVENWFKDYCINNYLRQDEIETILNANIWSKDRLASKIVDHYYMREIGYETIALFKHYVKVYMNEIMERYLPLIYSNCIKYNPLSPSIREDYTETFSRNINGSGESSSESSSSNNASGLTVSSDTPQGQISKANILNGTYASTTAANETETSISDETSTTNSNESEETYNKSIIKHRNVDATAQKLIQQYRQNIIAIDEQIIKELDKLFMGLY